MAPLLSKLEMHWKVQYAARYGYWRLSGTDVIFRYMEFGFIQLSLAIAHVVGFEDTRRKGVRQLGALQGRLWRCRGSTL